MNLLKSRRKDELRTIRFRLESNHDVESVVECNANWPLGTVVGNLGIKPRDGSLVLPLDTNGKPLHMGQRICHVPRDILLGTGKKVCHVWGEKWVNHLGETNHYQHGTIVVPGLDVGEYATVYITDHNTNDGLSYGYKIPTKLSDNYTKGDLVFVRVPRSGKTVNLFHPLQMRAFEYIDCDIERIRGFWGCCEIIVTSSNGRTGKLKLREDITPIPKAFKPKTNMKSDKKFTIKNYRLLNDELMIAKGKIKYGNAMIFGSPSAKTGTKYGQLLSSSRKGRPALVNLPGYRYGMSQVIKVPDEGKEVEIYHENEHKKYTCTILQKPDYDLESLRGRWVVAKLQRHNKYKRAFEIIGMPNDFL